MAKECYVCDCCGAEFLSGRARRGEHLCKDCIELRRCLKPYVRRLGVGRVLARAGKLLLGDAERE